MCNIYDLVYSAKINVFISNNLKICETYYHCRAIMFVIGWYQCNRCLSQLMSGVWISLIARCTRCNIIVYQWVVAGQWFSPGTPISSTNKTDGHDIAEILLVVMLNTITLPYCHCSRVIILLWKYERNQHTFVYMYLNLIYTMYQFHQHVWFQQSK
jgi:hypothetical protein